MTIRKRIYLAGKAVLFTLIACICVIKVNGLFVPKAYYDQEWPTTNTYEDFYRLKRNSVDALILGSSHAVTSVNPQVIYDKYGIVSYNLACEQQSPLISYYWLKEALKYQSPRAVIMDTYCFHKYYERYVYNDMNCPEGAVRKGMDNMRISPLKWKAAKEIEQYDPTQDALSFILLNIRYHTRWTGLGENDLNEKAMVEHGGIKGYSAQGGIRVDAETYKPFPEGIDMDQMEAEEMVPVAKEYIDRIIDLCEKENIQLIFISIPHDETDGRYKSNKELAAAKGIPYYDFNESKLYQEIGYDPLEDSLGHPTYLGAEKISTYIGRLLAEDLNIERRDDDTFDASRKVYEHKIEYLKLKETTDVLTYLDMLDNDKYSIFLFAPTAYSDYISDEMAEKLKGLGFETDLRGTGGSHYFGLRDAGGTTEQISAEDMSFTGSIRDGEVRYTVDINTESMEDYDDHYSLNIAGTEYAKTYEGLTIVVYDNDYRRVTDSVNISTNTAEVGFERQ